MRRLLKLFKGETTREHDVSTFVGVTPLDIYRPRDNLRPMFAATKPVFKLKMRSFN